MSNVTDEGLLAALSAGIDGTAPPSEETTDEETTTPGDGEGAADDAAGTGEGGDGAAGDGAGGEQPGDGTDDAAGEEGGEDEGAGRERDPATGKFVAKKKDGEEPAKADGAAPGADGKPAAKQGAAKDPVNDPIPQGLKKETQERMVALVNTAKTLTTERDHFKAAYQEHVEYIQSSGATPEQYGQAIEYLSWVNSGDPAKLEKCIQFMQTELAALSKLAGKPIAGVDVLADHADLVQEVKDGAISRQRAEEIAAARNNQAMRADHARFTQQQNTQTQQAQQARQQAMTDLNTLEQELMANDPQYAAKRPGILAALRAIDPKTQKTVIESTPPGLWQALFLKHYALAKAPAAPKTTTPGKTGSNLPRNQPLRAKQPAGGAAAAPKSMLDAVSAAIDNAG